MTVAKINRLIGLFDGALQTLCAQATLADAERLAILVHRSMDSKNRKFHTTDHVFHLCVGMNSHQVLAALFHDVVYFQLDGGVPEPASDLLQNVVRTEGRALVLQQPDADDTVMALCVSLFGFVPGQSLPLYGGMNEFLSATVAARSLQHLLSVDDLIHILACIEATIPFRAPNAEGITAVEILTRRVARASTIRLAWRAVKDAVTLANRDVSGFGQADPDQFLSNTWLLIEESNAPLQAVGIYSLQEYRGALLRMSGFLAHLDATSIFQSYKDTPDPQVLAKLGAVAKHNITFSCDFLDAKITAIAIIEALALCTGTDCPVSMFLGDIVSPNDKPQRVEDFLPEVPLVSEVNRDLLAALEKGRSLESSKDMTTSPLTAFIYRHLGQDGIRVALTCAKQMFEGELMPLKFLQNLKPEMTDTIIQACAQIAISRKAALLALRNSL